MYAFKCILLHIKSTQCPWKNVYVFITVHTLLLECVSKTEKTNQTRSIWTNEKCKDESVTNLRKVKVKQITRSPHLDIKAENPKKDIYRKIMWSRITMTSWQVSAHNNFFGFNLQYSLIFKLRKEVVANWTRHSTWQWFYHVPKTKLIH